MSFANNHLRYYKGYYKGVDWGINADNKELFQKRNDEILASQLPERGSQVPIDYDLNESECIDLQTTYPGLLIGSGITHGSGREGEIKIGFFFDYTTGLPILPGSSVKGVLRSVWPQGLRQTAKKETNSEKRKALLQKVEWSKTYIQEILSGIAPEHEWADQYIQKLEDFLFGTFEPGKANGKMSGRTIFYDAIPISASRVRVNKLYSDQYLGSDFITPHKKPLQDPIPIQFLKVLPGVVFRFQFRFVDFKEGDVIILEKSKIRALFELILTSIGIGAKTNTGYGQLEKPSRKPTPEERREANRGSIYSSSENDQKEPKGGPPLYSKRIEKDTIIEIYGEIRPRSRENKPNRIKFLTADSINLQGWKHKDFNAFEPGDLVKVKVRIHQQRNNEAVELISVEPYKP